MTTLLLSGSAALLVICIIIYPSPVFQSSLSGMKLWWEYVFPALLPFLVLSEIMTATGAIHALGTILNPFMRFAFRLSGQSGWVLAMGLVGGYPAGASMTGKLQLSNKIPPKEAQKLLALSHLCNPIVMITVIGIGFFHQISIGLFIAVIHYLSAFLAALLTRRQASSQTAADSQPSPAPQRIDQRNILMHSLHNAKLAQSDDGRTFGKILGDSVANSIQSLMLIGGWIMFFSVLNQIIALLLPATISTSTVAVLLPGFLEPHLGAYAISQSQAIPLLAKLALISAVLSWSGLSVHAQVKSLIHQTELRYASFFHSRLLHSVIALSLTPLLWKPFNMLSGHIAIPSIAPLNFGSSHWAANGPFTHSFWPLIGPMIILLLLLILILFACACLVSIIAHAYRLFKKA